MPESRLVIASAEDALLLKNLAVDAFQADFEQYGSFPPHIESTPWHQLSIESGHYYIIKYGSQNAGGILLVPKSLTEVEVKYFFIVPEFQDKHIGSDTIALLEQRYSDVRSWSLVTPYKAFRNHHFYQKLGYKKIGEIQPEPNENFWLFEYQKSI
ncbi:GNAT family N-acetyltransferase [Shewanella sp. TC10]|uniref:GNAT family N-acetyltransferase n=1 Tax=Shewanella sp. TC10 TaxID=1419739 RepID=UPI001892A652|nr:GNAT family N-acetyltransferase [Shewanella sp. TC10]